MTGEAISGPTLSMTRFDRPLPATVHGHYWVRPAAGSGPAPLLVGFHGYGENGEGFLASLEAIPGAAAWHVASVQALHLFYTRQGRQVVGSWMTRFDRDLAIADNVAYARAAVAAVREEVPATGTLVFAGFSQGVAMAYRAAAAETCAGVIALAGDVPPEVDPSRLPPVLIGRGRGDDWYDPEKLRADLGRLDAGGASAQVAEFDGGHEWTPEFHRAAGRFLARFRA